MNVAYPQSSTAPDTSDSDRKMQDSAMKLTITRDKLLAALQITSRAVSTRATLPSLGGIQLEAGDAGLTLRATDLELGLSTTGKEPRLEAPATVPLTGRPPSQLVPTLPAGEVKLGLPSDT